MESYLEIIHKLQKFGNVLTEHIGDKNLNKLGENKKGDFIRKRDLDWIRESDAVVAEITTPSLGVGYELRFAEELGKPILCLYRLQAGRMVSAMIAGNNKMRVKEYKAVDELESIFKVFLSGLQRASP